MQRKRPQAGRWFTIAAATLLFLAACGENATTPLSPAPATAVPTASVPTSSVPVTTGGEPAPSTSVFATLNPTSAPNATDAAATETGAGEAPQEGGAPANAAVDLPTATTTAPAFNPETTRLGTQEVAAGLNLPVFATHAGDGSGRLFIVEKAGTIRILQDGVLLATPYLDITNRVGSNANEQGLLGLAFDPKYAETGHFWVNFTDPQGDTLIARFRVTADANIADPSSYLPVLSLQQPAPNHNGGMLAFGPDGMLWIGTGDGGASGDRFGNGQNPATLLGKMLRLDVTTDPDGGYMIPPDNPWVTADWNGQAVRNEIWAVGLRNPWRYSFDTATGDLWIADVGQNVWEEVNYIAAGTGGGLNLGWPIMEGTHCFGAQTCDGSGLTLPVAEYDHSNHCSVTGGYVYRGAAYPQLSGVYFYGDYCSGRVWALYRDGSGDWQNPVAFESSKVLSSFAQDEEGEIYLIDYAGTLARLVVE